MALMAAAWMCAIAPVPINPNPKLSTFITCTIQVYDKNTRVMVIFFRFVNVVFRDEDSLF